MFYKSFFCEILLIKELLWCNISLIAVFQFMNNMQYDADETPTNSTKLGNPEYLRKIVLLLTINKIQKYLL